MEEAVLERVVDRRPDTAAKSKWLSSGSTRAASTAGLIPNLHSFASPSATEYGSASSQWHLINLATSFSARAASGSDARRRDSSTSELLDATCARTRGLTSAISAVLYSGLEMEVYGKLVAVFGSAPTA